MAEWLRCQIRNLMGSARMGSNPIIVACAKKIYLYIYMNIYCVTLWRNWITRRPPKVKIAGSNPARDVYTYNNILYTN